MSVRGRAMADRVIENNETEVPEIPEILEKVMLFALDEAREKMTQGNEIVPFTTLVIKENLFIESHPGETAEDCFNEARRTVEGARGAQAYAFCYDGYIDTDAGVQDAIIAEGGLPGEDEGMAIGLLYKTIGETIVPEEEPAYIGSAPNFMEGLKISEEYSDDEIEDKYLEEEDAE